MEAFDRVMEVRRGGPPRFRLLASASANASNRVHLSGAYRRWWAANLPTPYGYCACGCGRPTLIAPRDDRKKGHVAGEKKPFIDKHRRLWGRPHVTDPDRRCACGCGAPTLVANKTRLGEDGEIEEFAGMRATYLSRAHRPSESTARLDTPLGLLGSWRQPTALEVGYLAGVFDGRAILRGARLPRVQTTREAVVRRFAWISGRGTVSPVDRSGFGGRTVFLWRPEAPLEAVNLLHHLWPLLLPSTRSAAARYLFAHDFPPPEASLSVEPANEAGWLLGTIACRTRVLGRGRCEIADPGAEARKRILSFTFPGGEPLQTHRERNRLYLPVQPPLLRLLASGRELLPPEALPEGLPGTRV